MANPIRARRNETARELGLRFNRSPRTIRNIIAEERSEWIGRAHERGARIQKLHKQGLTMRAIAAEVGCGVGTVHRWVQRLETAEPTT